MENKNITCKDNKCPYNEEGICKLLTENDLINRKTCEERKF